MPKKKLMQTFTTFTSKKNPTPSLSIIRQRDEQQITLMQ
jgi:hypothetical protein